MNFFNPKPDLDIEQESTSEVIARLRSLKMTWTDKASDEELDADEEEKGRFSARLKENHEDYISYELYHELVGSTPRPGTTPHFDFPGEDSVVEFFERNYSL